MTSTELYLNRKYKFEEYITLKEALSETLMTQKEFLQSGVTVKRDLVRLSDVSELLRRSYDII